MKRKLFIQSGITLVVLFVFAFGVSVRQAYATTGCFADIAGNWAEAYICWMKDNGITNGTGGGNYSPNNNVTRAEMAAFMQRQAEVPPSTGDIYINQGLSAMQPGGNFATTAYVRYFSDYTVLGASAIGTDYFILSATIPTSLYGRATMLKGALMCYDATQGTALTMVFLHHNDYAGTIVNTVTDATSRTDSTCRTYYFTAPSQLFATDHVTLNFAGNFTSTSNPLYIRSVAFILAPSTLTGAFSPIPGQEPIQDPALLPDPATMSGSNP
jgi:hypothetical protein